MTPIHSLLLSIPLAQSKRIQDWNAEAPVLGAPPSRPPPPGMEASSVMLSEVALSEEGDGADLTDDALDAGPSFGDDDITDEDGIMTGEESEPMLLLPPS
ncbi:hypothetical protein H632_c1371p0 [Helicosporidium sp. ATCC 50920]|nr:hypothetical protein H632_c1371p0 [Helicosporidium sp. ATCC 50920]|eukprot:KDD74361.1 hypothetical protein H632_c1371p0 [Helicosporidium sp. ATCC 50920]